MPETPNKPTELPAGTPDEGHQLGVLLDVARAQVDEEFRRGERLDSKARHQFTAVGGLFAVVMAVTAGVLNALLDQKAVDAWVYPVLGGCAIASIVALALALAWSGEAWRLRKSSSLAPETITNYISHAERGNVAVTKKLITAYATILESRLKQNLERAREVRFAALACIAAGTASLIQLAAVFVALISK